MTCSDCQAHKGLKARTVMVKLCPLHAAAERMREILQAFVSHGWSVSTDKKASDLLRELEGQP